MYRPKRWNLAEERTEAPELAGRLKISPLVAQVLLNRGLSKPEECQSFLQPSLNLLHDPSLLPGLTVAAKRIARAVHDGQKIVIYGDYDVDGITATAILWHALKLLGGRVEYYIPHRLDEGYGLNSEAIGQIIDAGAQLIITVDCGITAIDEAKIARDRGVDLIVTDHHEWKHEPAAGIEDLSSDPKPILPHAVAIVHPRLPIDPSYPNPHLCGAGVALKLAWGIGQAINGTVRVTQNFRDFLLEATALAALGTIADVVPLIGENRVLAHYGLGGLKESQLAGIKALIASASLTGQKLDSYHVGFLLAPRLNACGRMGHARLAVQMLTDADPKQAMEIAIYLEQQNRARQAMEKTILEQALAQIESGGWADPAHRALVLASDGWHGGVIGIVASRLVDRFCRPTILIALTDGQGQGSGRSVLGFHLAQALSACGKHLDAFGGHEMAAGLKIQANHVDAFRDAFIAYANAAISEPMLVPEIKLDGLAQLRQITEPAVNDLRRLGPFGHGNRKPLLCVKDISVATTPRRVGKTGEHLQILIRQGDDTMKCIAFRFGELIEKLTPGTPIELAVEPTINEFNGRRSVELEVKDLRFIQSVE